MTKYFTSHSKIKLKINSTVSAAGTLLIRNKKIQIQKYKIDINF